jgi:hypothetical protein
MPGFERMADELLQVKPTDTMTVLEGFDAVRIFLEAVWERQGKDAAEISFIVGVARWEDGTPADLTIWDDWLMAVQICRSM